MKKKKETKMREKHLNLRVYEIQDMKYAFGPLWRSHYDNKYRKRLFRPSYISR